MTTPFDPDRREQPRRLGTVPTVGLGPMVDYPPLCVVRNPPPSQPARHLSVADQRQFTAWARRQSADVATVADLAVIAAAEEAAENAVFPPSPALRVKWGRVAAWSPVLLLAAVGLVFTARFAAEHWRGMFLLSGFGLAYASCWIKPAGKR